MRVSLSRHHASPGHSTFTLKLGGRRVYGLRCLERKIRVVDVKQSAKECNAM